MLNDIINKLGDKAKNGKKPTERKVWSISLKTWIKIFQASNVEGKTAIAHDALGAPVRLQYDADGAVRFTKQGKPVIRVAKDISDNVRFTRELIADGLVEYANGVEVAMPEQFKAEQDACIKAGKPIDTSDALNLFEALKRKSEAEAKAGGDTVMAQAEAVVASKPKRKATKAPAPAPIAPTETPAPAPEKELVPA